MNNVRAKFTCVGIEDQPEFQQKNVSFFPVSEGSEENKSFSKYTPAGSVNLTISYETEAVNAFEVGKEYYLDFTEAGDKQKDFKSRVVEEKEQLEKKLYKLDAFLESEKAKEVDDVQLALLHVQATAMNAYLQSLKERIERF